MKPQKPESSAPTPRAEPAASSVPSHLTVEVYPADERGPFPEFELDSGRSDRYLPSQRPLGVAISGGGTRSLSAAIGQMRALRQLGLLDAVGAVSCVSGGTWFGTLFNYVSDTISDETLLGPMIAPNALTLADIRSLDPNNLGAPVPEATNGAILKELGELVKEKLLGRVPFNRFYSRIVGTLLLKPHGLDDTRSFFALDGHSVNAIVAANPGLSPGDFLTVRQDRPYFIANATQIFPDDEKAVRRHFAYTPLYIGTPQLFRGAGPAGQDFGGGYSQAFAFDSKTPTGASSPVSVTTPDPIFLLSDVMGSSGSAPAASLNQLGLADDGFPQFNSWPTVDLGQQASALYSFDDGGSLEDTGIVSLLYRQYPVILAFVNAELPIGSQSDESVDGISGQVSRLFGKIPNGNLGNTQDTQVFSNDNGEWDALVQGLKSNESHGAFFTADYTIQTDNTFGIVPYPGDGKVTVVWFYLNLNQDWKSKITDPKVLQVLDSHDPDNRFSNFPNYATVGQNTTLGIIPEVVMLTAEQVQLLANMTAFTVAESAGGHLASLVDRVSK